MFSLLAAVALLAEPIEERPNQEIVQAPPIEFKMPSEPLLLPPLPDRPRKYSALSVSLSALFPGLGHYYLGDMLTGTSLVGSSAASLGAISTHNRSAAAGGLFLFQCIWSYGLYAAYRDTRAYNGVMSYSYQMPMEDFGDLSTAPLRWSVMKKPEVWGFLLLDLGAALGLSYLAFSKIDVSYSAVSKAFSPLAAFPVAVGEEAFFRGFLQSALSEGLSPTAGLILASLAFGAAHIPNAKALPASERWRYYSAALPLITAGGFYYGYLTLKNRSLKEAVALHTWYDLTLFALESMATESIAHKQPRLAVSFAF